MNKASGGDWIPVELFQILKDDAVKVLHSICQQIWKTQQWPQDWKSSVFIPTPKEGDAKECSNCHTIALISHTSKVIRKILQARLQWYVNRELPDVQAEFRKGRGTRDQIANICWIIEKARVLQKNINFCLSHWLYGSQETVENPERWCCESAALNMSANLENSAVAPGLEKVSFHSNPKEKNVQTTVQLHSSHMLVKWCSNSPRQALAIYEPWTSWCSSWF